MSDAIWTLIELGGAVIVIGCCSIVFLKCIWNFGLPYAMIYELLKTKKYRGWSAFPLIECIPLLFGIGISWLTNQQRWLSSGIIAKFGFGLILLSYLHLFIAPMILGVWFRKSLKSIGKNENS